MRSAIETDKYNTKQYIIAFTSEGCVAMFYQMLHAFEFCTGYCYNTADEPELYLEEDQIPGYTSGDKPLNIGDRLHVGEVANIDACNNW